MGEPDQDKRVRIGVWVLLFLSVLTLFTWRLNAAYWKDIK
jgi:ubiquinol-cytochrome c reductase cytochrome c1 subunit